MPSSMPTMKWSVNDMTVREIAAAAGLSLRALAARFGIPARTMEDWSAGRRTPPPYVLQMMIECLGLQAEKGETK